MRENKRAGARKVMIEKRKEDAERQLAMRERKEEEDRLLQARLAEATEEERRRQERCLLTQLMATGISECSQHMSVGFAVYKGTCAGAGHRQEVHDPYPTRIRPAFVHEMAPRRHCIGRLAPGRWSVTVPQHMMCTLRRRLKREEQRIAKEIEEREQEEARKLLEQAQKKGVKKLNIAEGATLDKATLMNQVRPSPVSSQVAHGDRPAWAPRSAA